MRILRTLVVVLFVMAALSLWFARDELRNGLTRQGELPAPDTLQAPSGPTDPKSTPEPDGIDITPPQIFAITVVPEQIDTTASKQLITITLHITDDLSGLLAAKLHFAPTFGGTQYLDFAVDSSAIISGDGRNGIYQTSAFLPKYSAHGRWYLSNVYMSDNANNSSESFGAIGGRPIGDGGVTDGGIVQPQPAQVFTDETPYFINGEDSGPPIEPLPVEITPDGPPEPGPLPPDGDAAAEVTPSPNKMYMPTLSE
jgi:hypothetical protein